MTRTTNPHVARAADAAGEICELLSAESATAARAFDAFLCRAWGETDLPSAELVWDWEGVRRFMVREWLGEEDEEVLLQVKDDFAQHEEDMGTNGGPFSIEFEIGGVSVERVCGFAAPRSAAPEAGLADTERLDYLQKHGATVELAHQGGGKHKFRIGGLYAAVHQDIRVAIDEARTAKGGE